jgi:hypothetical protein
MNQLLGHKYLRFGVVVLLLALTFGVRLYRLDTPLADWHSWRQADTAAVARNFATEKFDMLYPQSDSLWALSEHQLPNPNRYFINEFPLYNAVVAKIYQAVGHVDHRYGRLVSDGMATLGAWALYGLVAELLGVIPALFTLALYALLPYNVYYGRVFMPDPSFVALSIMALYFLVRFVRTRRWRDGSLLGIFFALAMLVKPYAIFITLPIVYWIVIHRQREVIRDVRYYLLAIFPFVPLLLWRYHISRHPEGAFASQWLLNGEHIRFTGAFFRWIIFDRLNRLIFATGGFVLFVYGLFAAPKTKNTSFFFVWTLAIFAYITIFAKGNVNHDYYQLPIVAPGIVLMVIAARDLLASVKTRGYKLYFGTVIGALWLIMLAFGWFEVRGFFNINNMAMVQAGQAADRLLPPEAVVIAPYQGDPAFLYQINRNGWPVGGNIEERMRDGATYYVTTSFDTEYQELKAKYTLVEQTDQYGILKLAK